jgi:hypothetical protein
MVTNLKVEVMQQQEQQLQYKLMPKLRTDLVLKLNKPNDNL